MFLSAKGYSPRRAKKTSRLVQASVQFGCCLQSLERWPVVQGVQVRGCSVGKMGYQRRSWQAHKARARFPLLLTVSFSPDDR
mgnify:CR=1 FL=1